MKKADSEIALLYEQNFEKIYRFFYYKVLSKELSEDLTSDTFLGFVSERKKRDDIKNNQAFLYGIAHNVFNQFLKKKYKNPTIDVPPDYFEQYVNEFLEEVESKKTLEEKVMKYIKLLPNKQAKIANMRLIDKLNNKEISRQISKNSNYVKVTLHRALKNLRRLVACTP